ncbi:MAG: hydrolase [Hamadaea sp.]|uniref:GH25 family lysozyme n=1 Tax=Hamadaea sp. TaxID=2024425 RepID=UPI001833ECFB|nr:GH25 family lysozyme [Hamadaea sp.]NUT20931.1 hydrolase [Hamadaea sp.]
MNRRIVVAVVSVVAAASSALAVVTAVDAAESDTAPPMQTAAVTGTLGIDVNSWNGSIDWASAHTSGVQWAYLKATEGTSVKDTSFNTNYPAAYYAGVVRGAYHVARPNLSNGTVQADFLASNGGAWSADGKTLPALLDIEPNPFSGGYCYGLSQSGMVSWINAFLTEYKARTTRWAVIHTTLSFWKICTGNYSGFAGKSPLSIIRWDTSAGTLPAGWSVYTFWQSTNCRATSGITGCADGSTFNGAYDRLVALANNT